MFLAYKIPPWCLALEQLTLATFRYCMCAAQLCTHLPIICIPLPFCVTTVSPTSCCGYRVSRLQVNHPSVHLFGVAWRGNEESRYLWSLSLHKNALFLWFFDEHTIKSRKDVMIICIVESYVYGPIYPHFLLELLASIIVTLATKPKPIQMNVVSNRSPPFVSPNLTGPWTRKQ